MLVAVGKRLFASMARFVLPTSIITAGVGTTVYTTLYELISLGFSSGRTPAEVIDQFERYTGLRYGTDTDFAAASATIAAQTGLSTFFCFASFIMILFLAPPSRVFA